MVSEHLSHHLVAAALPNSYRKKKEHRGHQGLVATEVLMFPGAIILTYVGPYYMQCDAECMLWTARNQTMCLLDTWCIQIFMLLHSLETKSLWMLKLKVSKDFAQGTWGFQVCLLGICQTHSNGTKGITPPLLHASGENQLFTRSPSVSGHLPPQLKDFQRTEL